MYPLSHILCWPLFAVNPFTSHILIHNVIFLQSPPSQISSTILLLFPIRIPIILVLNLLSCMMENNGTG
jgi:hypothetical protein